MIMTTLLSGCIGTDRPADNVVPIKAQEASCDECHAFPGTKLCKTDSVGIAGLNYTECYRCHSGAIRVDSSFDAAGNAFIYHDAMQQTAIGRLPRTDSLHTDVDLTLNFTQCSACHSFPPSEGLHSFHVGSEGKKCFECHFQTIESDTEVFADGTVWETFFVQKMQRVFGGNELPRVKKIRHINRALDIAFRKKFQDPAMPDSMFRWNPADKSCSNIECHTGPPDGASIVRTWWRQGVDR
jgi:hypothetical protein